LFIIRKELRRQYGFHFIFSTLSFFSLNTHVQLPSPKYEKLTWVKQAMHAGVIRDMEQQRIKKERQLDFDMQRQLEAEYKKLQSVHDGGKEG
jgi:hypothetical protein